MKIEVRIIRIKARDIQTAMNKIKEKRPYAKMVTYEFEEDFRYTRNKDYNNRIMRVAIVPDTRKILR